MLMFAPRSPARKQRGTFRKDELHNMKPDTKYAEIYQYLCRYIKQNELSRGDKLPTEGELSQKFNASRVTVRRAIKELCDRNMVYKIQGGGTYVGTPGITQATGENNIPLVISQAAHFFGSMVQGMENYLSQSGCHLTLHCSNNNHLNERAVLLELAEKNAKTIIISPCRSNRNNSLYFDMMRRGINLVFVDLMPNGMNCNYVSSDNYMAGFLAGQHLINQGCSNFALLRDNIEGYSSVREREAGYRFAMDEAGIELPAERVISMNSPENEIESAVRRLMSLDSPPDAVFCNNDIIAINTLVSAQRLGYHVPDDFALIGVDNLDMDVLQVVPLSTVAQDFYEIGRTAAELALSQAESTSGQFIHKAVPVHLIPRASTQRK